MQFYFISTSHTPQKFATLLEKFVLLPSFLFWPSTVATNHQHGRVSALAHKAATVFWFLTPCRFCSVTLKFRRDMLPPSLWLNYLSPDRLWSHWRDDMIQYYRRFIRSVANQTQGRARGSDLVWTNWKCYMSLSAFPLLIISGRHVKCR